MREPTAGAGTTAGPASDLPEGVEASRATGWVAWVLLAAVFLVLLGAVHLGMGLVAIFNPDVLAASRSDRLLSVGDGALATVHLVLGAVAVVTGVGLVRGQQWARALTVVLAVLAAVVNFAFVSVHPVWSVAALVLITVVIYAAVAHGGEMADAYAG